MSAGTVAVGGFSGTLREVGSAVGGTATASVDALSGSRRGGIFSSSSSTNPLLALAEGSRDGRLSIVAYLALDGKNRDKGGSRRFGGVVGGVAGGELSGDAPDELAV